MARFQGRGRGPVGWSHGQSFFFQFVALGQVKRPSRRRTSFGEARCGKGHFQRRIQGRIRIGLRFGWSRFGPAIESIELRELWPSDLRREAVTWCKQRFGLQFFPIFGWIFFRWIIFGSNEFRTAFGSGRPSRPSGSSDRPRSGSAPSPRARSGGDDRATRRSTSEDGWADGPALETPRSWGGVARRGAGAATGRRVVGASRAWRDAVEAATPQRRPDSARRAAPGTIPDEATDAERRAANDARTSEDEAIITEVRDDAAPAVSRSRSRSSSPRRDPAPIDLAGEVREQLSRAVGSARTERVEKRLAEAAEHFESERYGDAARILKKSVDEAPTVAAVHELYGLTLYRQEKWKPAARELEAFRLLSNSTDQHPVLADCYRAMRQWAQVGELWDELRAASPSAELVTEGRIVMAGSLADRDDLAGAIALLEQSFNFPKRPMPHHLRRAYVLADLYERSGDLPKARTMFGRIENIDPDFADVRVRVRALR